MRAAGRTAHLQGTVSDAEPAGGDPQIAVLFVDDDTHGHVGRRLADILQPGAGGDRVADAALEIGIAPAALDPFARALGLGNVTDGDGSAADMAAADPRDQLAQIA